LPSDAKKITLGEAAALVPDGARIAFGGGGALMRRPMAFARELVRHGATNLDIFHFLGGLEVDLLIAAGAVRSTNCAYLGLLEYGQAPAFQRAVQERAITVNEYSEFMFTAGLRAADLGLPFIPWRTPWGSDMVGELGLKTVADPYSEQVLLAVPPLTLDVAVIHVERVDTGGFVQAAAEPDLVWDYDWLIARVAKTTIVCAEEVASIADPAHVAVMGREVAAVVEVPRGAWPTGLHPLYEPDSAHVTKTYMPAAAAGGELLDAYMREFVEGGEGGND
jgi:glutaconate CoA-transferase subunit A